MGRRPSTFTQRDIARAVRGVMAAGLRVARVEISRDGGIVIVAGNPIAAEDTADRNNEWDDALP